MGAEGVEKAQNFNAVDDLMQAHRGTITREAAFQKNVGEYTAHFKKNEELEEERKQQCGIIQTNGPAFMAVAGGGVSNPATSQFFMQLNEAMTTAGLVTQMTEQGFTFYN